MAVSPLPVNVSEFSGPFERLAHVLNVTRDMLVLAGEGNWDRVAELERERRDDLALCFKVPVSEENGELVAEALAVILHLNEELMSLLAAAREDVLQQGAKQVRTRAALGQYQDIQQHQSP